MHAETSAFVPPPRETRWLRVTRVLLAAALGLNLTVLTGLLLVSWDPSGWGVFEGPFLLRPNEASLRTIGGTLVMLLPIAAVALATRRRWLTMPGLLVGCAAAAGVFTWLAWDEPVRKQPQSSEQFSPVFPGAAESYVLLMRYSKKAPSPEAKAYESVKLSVQWAPKITPRDPEKWREFVLAQRAGLEADWLTLAPQRRWLEELAAFDQIGDLTPPRSDANILTFQVWRTLSQRACAIATLQALEGRGDDAIATLLPIIRASRRLQPCSRTLVRVMIGVVAEKLALETTALVLESTSVSADSKTQLIAALGPENARELAHRLVLTEQAFIMPFLDEVGFGQLFTLTRTNGKGVLGASFSALTLLIVNRRATANCYGEYLTQLAALAEARELDQLAASEHAFQDRLRETGMKNLGGRLFLQMATPSFDKVIKAHWQTADIRSALRERLANG